jgi:hypothetical protein
MNSNNLLAVKPESEKDTTTKILLSALSEFHSGRSSDNDEDFLK